MELCENLTINFSEVCPMQILDLMIRLQNTFARRLEDVLRTSRRRLQNVFKTFWRRFCKTSGRCLEDAWWGRKYWSWSRRLEDVFWRCMIKANIFVLIKTYWRRRRKTSSRRLQDFFIETNVCRIQSAINTVSETIVKRKNDYKCHLTSKLNSPKTSPKTYWSIL